MIPNTGVHFILKSFKKYNILIWLSLAILISMIFTIGMYKGEWPSFVVFIDAVKSVKDIQPSRFHQKFIYYEDLYRYFSMIVSPLIMITCYLLMHFVFLKKVQKKYILISLMFLFIIQLISLIMPFIIEYYKLLYALDGFLNYSFLIRSLLQLVLNSISRGILLVFYLINILILLKSKITRNHYTIYIILLISYTTINLVSFLLNIANDLSLELIGYGPNIDEFYNRMINIHLVTSIFGLVSTSLVCLMIYGFISEFNIGKNDKELTN